MNICIFGRTMPAHRDHKGMFHSYLMGTELSKRNHKVTIITTSRKDGVSKEILNSNMIIYYLDNTQSDCYSESYWRESAKKFDEIYKQEKFDVVSSDSEAAYGWVIYSKYKDMVPLVHVKHNTLSMLNDMWKLKTGIFNKIKYFKVKKKHLMFFNRITIKLFGKAEIIVCVSKFVANAVSKDYPKIKGKIRIIYNGARKYSFEEAEKKELKDKLNVLDEKIIVYIGRLVPEKGINYIISALRKLNKEKYKAFIIGHGSTLYVRRLHSLIRKNKIENRITLIPGLKHSEVQKYLAISDIFLFPTFHVEGLPFVLIESFASNTAVIASPIGGVKELISDGLTGYLISPKNANILAKKIMELLTNEKIRLSLAREAQELYYKRFTIEKMIENIEDVFKEAICNIKKKRLV